MGPPILVAAKIPIALDQPRCVRHPLTIDGQEYAITCVSMGNPHAVCFVESMDKIDLRAVGSQIERHPLFPERVNFHLAQTHSPREVSMRTWERGSGITMACGTGACAVLVAGVLEERLERSALVHLPGGDLSIQWAEGDTGTVFMTGPATEVFSGVWETPDA
jgi:diaminopimelate epimerase